MIFFFEKHNKTVKSTFWLFNLCNGEKNWKNTWREKWENRPSVSFCSALVKNCHFGASLMNWNALVLCLCCSFCHQTHCSCCCCCWRRSQSPPIRAPGKRSASTHCAGYMLSVCKHILQFENTCCMWLECFRWTIFHFKVSIIIYWFQVDLFVTWTLV